MARLALEAVSWGAEKVRNRRCAQSISNIDPPPDSRQSLSRCSRWLFSASRNRREEAAQTRETASGKGGAPKACEQKQARTEPVQQRVAIIKRGRNDNLQTSTQG